jgi:hypothetical protein
VATAVATTTVTETVMTTAITTPTTTTTTTTTAPAPTEPKTEPRAASSNGLASISMQLVSDDDMSDDKSLDNAPQKAVQSPQREEEEEIEIDPQDIKEEQSSDASEDSPTLPLVEKTTLNGSTKAKEPAKGPSREPVRFTIAPAAPRSQPQREKERDANKAFPLPNRHDTEQDEVRKPQLKVNYAQSKLQPLPKGRAPVTAASTKKSAKRKQWDVAPVSSPPRTSARLNSKKQKRQIQQDETEY